MNETKLDDNLLKILFQLKMLIRHYNNIRTKNKTFRTMNDRDLALMNDSIRDLKRRMYLYDKEQEEIYMS